MSEVLVVDTTIFLNVLDVPGRNQHRQEVFAQFRALGADGAVFLLPVATVIESGNHIARIGDGRLQRRYAERFCDDVRRALNRESPWNLAPLPDEGGLSSWLDGFPNAAMQGVGMGDHSIVRIWEAACDSNPYRRVRIWSRDRHLAGYDRIP